MPYRDSKGSRLLAEALGGCTRLVPVLHLRADRFEEAEAVLILGQKLDRLSEAARYDRSDSSSWRSELSEKMDALQAAGATDILVFDIANSRGF